MKPALTALVILAIPPILIQTTLAFSQVPDLCWKWQMPWAWIKEKIPAGGSAAGDAWYYQWHPYGDVRGYRKCYTGGLYWRRRAGNSDFQRNQSAETEYLVIGGGTVAVITMLCSMALGAVEKKNKSGILKKQIKEV